MPGIEIVDGKGRGYTAEVGSDHRLRTDAVTRPTSSEAARAGEAFGLLVEVSLLVADGESAVLYFLNNEERNVEVGFFDMTQPDYAVWRLYGGVTGGTLVAAGDDIMPLNPNLTSGRSLNATVKGANASGQTITGGAQFATLGGTEGSVRGETVGVLILGPGTTFAITCEPSANMDVATLALVYLQ